MTDLPTIFAGLVFFIILIGGYAIIDRLARNDNRD